MSRTTSDAGAGAPWVVLLPAKPPSRGKSRLALPDVQRRRLAVAFALDTATAALLTPSVAEVLAVTDDSRFAAELGRLGCTVMPDGVGGDLNGALVQAAAEARRRHPGLRPAALCADLPALRTVDLEYALRAAAQVAGPAYVSDAEGSGTTLYAAPYDEFAPRFGAASAAAHAEVAHPVAGELATLRRDVDTLADITTSATLGLGVHSAAALAAIGPGQAR